MLPVVYINCSVAPFVDYIMSRRKVYETRSRDMLRSMVGQRVLIAETGKSPRSVVRCSAVIVRAFPVTSRHGWNMFRDYTMVPHGCPYDWKPGTRSRWLYELADIRPVPVPYHPADGIRHGRVWMEYNGKEDV